MDKLLLKKIKLHEWNHSLFLDTLFSFDELIKATETKNLVMNETV